MTTTTYSAIRYTYSDGDVLSDGTPTPAALRRLSQQITDALSDEFPGAAVDVTARCRTSGGGTAIVLTPAGNDVPDYQDEERARVIGERAWERWCADLTDSDLVREEE